MFSAASSAAYLAYGLMFAILLECHFTSVTSVVLACKPMMPDCIMRPSLAACPLLRELSASVIGTVKHIAFQEEQIECGQ